MRNAWILSIVIAATFTVAGMAADPKVNDQQSFDTARAAVDSLLTACKDNDAPALVKMFGPRYQDLLKGIDDAEEKEHRRMFWERSQQHLKLIEVGDDRVEVVVGRELWSFPIPLVKQANGWVFATDEGLEELAARRIGENELNAIDVCLEFGSVQREYAAVDRDGDEVREYAQRITSTPGKRDGLYWPVEADSAEPMSPLGQLLADAEAAAPGRKPGSPYQGYYFRMITRQGADAPGGAYDYVINDNMIAGFALVAWPAEYRTSGITTFIISHQGKLLEKDLGPDTAKLVEAMTTYNPDKTWTPVKP
jgi:hypothetical protein